MKILYTVFTNKRCEIKKKIISGLVITASISIAAIIGITIGTIIVSKSIGTINIIKDESDDAVDTIKRRVNHVVKDIHNKKRILTRNIRIGFKKVSGDIYKTVKKVSNDFKR
ncbi:MAG: hypothetical protein ACYCWE_11895 [Eubacteriales bacterium]